MIDFHVHVYPPEIIKNAEKISSREPYFNALTHNKVHRWATVDDLLSAMKENGVERSVIFGFAFQDLELCRICNDYVISAVKNYPERLSGFCVVPPSVHVSARASVHALSRASAHASAHASTRGFEAEIIRCAEQGLIGVGELFPEGQGFDITDKRETQSLAGILEELGLILLLHTAEPVGHDYIGKGNIGPKEAAVFCSNNPELKVIFAHLGGGLWLYELMPEMKEILANAYYDLAALPWLYKPEILTAIKGAGLIEKFLFGSDFPILTPQRYEKIFTDSVASGLSAADIEAITRRNALKLFSQK